MVAVIAFAGRQGSIGSQETHQESRVMAARANGPTGSVRRRIGFDAPMWAALQFLRAPPICLTRR
jgi:hypothetical protein